MTPFQVGAQNFVIGDTAGHIAYFFPEDRLAFVGDTLFALGCGRLFEGTPAQMWNSLTKILAWPDDTLLYCAHEYTASNLKFALAVEPDNAALQAYAAEVTDRRSRGEATVRFGDGGVIAMVEPDLEQSPRGLRRGARVGPVPVDAPPQLQRRRALGRRLRRPEARRVAEAPPGDPGARPAARRGGRRHRRGHRLLRRAPRQHAQDGPRLRRRHRARHGAAPRAAGEGIRPAQPHRRPGCA